MDADGNSWLEPPPPGFRNELTGFALLYKTLDFWLTPVTQHYLNHPLEAAVGCMAPGSGPDHMQVLSTFSPRPSVLLSPSLCLFVSLRKGVWPLVL